MRVVQTEATNHDQPKKSGPFAFCPLLAKLTVVTPPLPPDLEQLLHTLGNHLVWRIGKDDLSDLVIVRVGYASALSHFAQYSRLRNTSDGEIQQALEEGTLVIEWVH